MPLIRRIATPHGPVSILRDAATGEMIYKQGGARQSESDGLGVSTSAYIHAIFGSILQRPARRVLTIGCGAGCLATMLARAGKEVVCVDLNPLSFDIARQYFSLDDRVECIAEDGVRFLRRDARRWDAIVLDAYDGNELPRAFTTPAFAALVRAKLNPKIGRYMANIFVTWPDDPIADRYAMTMGLAFGRVRMLDETSSTHRNCIVMAGAVAGLAEPTMAMPPACAAGKVFEDLAGFRFL